MKWLAVLLLLAVAGPARAQSLSEGRAIVTGTRADTRAEGLAAALRDVLVKLSGDPAWLDAPVTEAQATAATEDFAYLDRMTDLPRHDEQGSRDRPFTLIAHFDLAKLEALLATRGDRIWRGARPALVMRADIQDRAARYPLTADGDNDERHRQALLAAAERYAMRVVLVPGDRLAQPDPRRPDAVALRGFMTWSDDDFGWVSQWTMTWRGRRSTWGVKGVSFDEAYRDAVRGAMAILSGHKKP